MTCLIKYVFQQKHISCEYKCRFDGRKSVWDQWWNNDKCWCECQKPHISEKDYVWNPAACNCENGKKMASIMDNLVIVYVEVIRVIRLRRGGWGCTTKQKLL